MFKSIFQAFGFGYDDDNAVMNIDNRKMDLDEIHPPQVVIPPAEIIFITTHGNLIVQQKNGLSQPKLVPVPNNMEVIKINITAPGVVNITNESDIIYYYNSIIEVFQQLRNPNIPILELKQIINKIIKKIQKQFDEKVKIKKTEIIGDDIDSYVRDFKRYSDRAFQVSYLNPGNLIADKEYSRSESDDKTDIDFRILNVADGVDLLSEDDDEITTKGLMDHFSKNGTTRLIIFDFSCSTCYTMNDRDTRGFRRTITTQYAYGGNKKRTLHNKRKTKEINIKNTKKRPTRKK